MGLDLDILPLIRGLTEGNIDEIMKRDSTVLASTKLRFDRDPEMFSQIASPKDRDRMSELGRVVQTYPLPPDMKILKYTEKGLKETRKSGYHTEEMVYTTAKELRKLRITDDASSKNKAIMEYVRTLPGDIPILIDWS